MAIVVTIVVAWVFYYLDGRRGQQQGATSGTAKIIDLLDEIRKGVRLGLTIILFAIGVSTTLLAIIIRHGDENPQQAQIENVKAQNTVVPDSVRSDEFGQY